MATPSTASTGCRACGTASCIVKEFDLEQAADLWLLLDLERAAHAGLGESASVETAVTAAASIALQTLPRTGRWG